MPRKCRPTSLAESLAERAVESHKKALKRPKGSISEVYLFFRSPKTIRIPFGPLRLMFRERKRSNSCHEGRRVKDGYRIFHSSTIAFPRLGSRKASRKIEPGERLLTPILCNVVAQHFTCQQLFWAYAVQCSGSPHALGRRLRRCNARAQQGQSRDPWMVSEFARRSVPTTTDLVHNRCTL